MTMFAGCIGRASFAAFRRWTLQNYFFALMLSSVSTLSSRKKHDQVGTDRARGKA
jgi:hypothetical protein